MIMTYNVAMVQMCWQQVLPHAILQSWSYTPFKMWENEAQIDKTDFFEIYYFCFETDSYLFYVNF